MVVELLAVADVYEALTSERSAALLFASGRTVAIAHRMAAEIARLEDELTPDIIA